MVRVDSLTGLFCGGGTVTLRVEARICYSLKSEANVP